MKERLCCSRTESFNSFFNNYVLIFVGRGVTLVDSMPLDRRSWVRIPFQPPRQGPWASPSLTVGLYNIYYIMYILYTVACSASSCKLRHCQLLWSGAPLSLLSSLPSAVPTMRLSQNSSRLPFCLFLVALPVLVVFGYFSPSGPP